MTGGVEDSTHVAGVDTGVNNVDVDARSRRAIVSVGEVEVVRVLVSKLRRLADPLKTPRSVGPRG